MERQNGHPSRRRLLLSLAAAFVAGCTAPPPAALMRAESTATGQPVAFDAPGLAIRGRYHPPSRARSARRLWVVIEGDGALWRNGQPPRDPTPRKPIGPTVIPVLPADDARLWLARPCQYLTPSAHETCDSRYWTTDRFAAPVLAAYNTLIDLYASGRQIVLIGFSGGGVLAADLALARADTAGLITLAAPLDLAAWTAHHGVPPLSATVPSGKRLHDLANLDAPALYLFGARDTVVPPAMLSRTRRLLPGDAVKIVPGARHSDNWAQILRPHLAGVVPPTPATRQHD